MPQPTVLISQPAKDDQSDDRWVITIKERKVKEKAKKIREPSYTLFVLTPNNHLALSRTLREICQFHHQLRSNYPSSLEQIPSPAVLQRSIHGHSGSSSLESAFARSSKRASITVMSATAFMIPNSQKKLKQSKMQVLQSITRTLSPPKSKSAAKSGPLRPSGMLPTPPESPLSKARDGNLLERPSDDEEDFVDVQLTESEKQFIRLNEPLQEHEESQIGAYFTELSQLPIDPSSSQSASKGKARMLRETTHWQDFFRIGKNDFERERKTPINPPYSSMKDSSRTALYRSPTSTCQDQAQIPANGVAPGSNPTTQMKRVKSEQVVSTCNPIQATPPAKSGAKAKDVEVEEQHTDEARRKVEVELGLSPESADVINRLSTSSRDSLDTETKLAALNVPSSVVSDPSSNLGSTASSSTARADKATITQTDGQIFDKQTPGLGPSPPRLALRQRHKVTVKDFEILSVLGKGCAGKVLMVKYKKASSSKADRVYAMKSIKKNHVLAHRELQHTLTEQSVLRRVADEPDSNPFIVRLWWSFHDQDHLFLVMDFHPGGDLATQLARWGRLGRDRARFYAAEIAEGVTALHRSGVIYRDLKPENILIAFDGHIVLTDFGLSKQFPRSEDVEPLNDEEERTMTFCGTAEYLAPEVLLGEPYSYEVDWWSFGTMLYEMLSGLTPFWSEDHATMYRRVLHDELAFSEDSNRVMDHDTKTLLRGLLQRNPSVRMSGDRIKKHPYFGMIDWDHVRHKRYIPPYVPAVNPNDATDTQNFDETFLAMEPTYVQDDDPAAPSAAQGGDESAEAQKGENDPAGDDENAPGPIEPQRAYDDKGRDVFDGYSYLAPRDERDSIIEEDLEEDLTGDVGSTENGTETAVPEGADYRKSRNLEDVEESLNTASNSDDVYSTTSTRPTSAEKDDLHESRKTKDSKMKSKTNRSKPAGSDGLRPPEDNESPSIEDGGDEDENGDVDSEAGEDWDVVDTPEGGEWDTNGRRKKPNNTLFARGVVDKYKLRMRKLNDGPGSASLSASTPNMPPNNGNSVVTPFGSTRSNIFPPVFGRSNSVDLQSSSSITQQPSDCSENGASLATSSKPNGSTNSKSLKIFNLRNKKFSQSKNYSNQERMKKQQGSESERRGILPASMIIGAHFLKNRSMSNYGPDGSSQNANNPNAEAATSSKKKLNLNGLLSHSNRHLTASNEPHPNESAPPSISVTAEGEHLVNGS